MYKLEYVKYKKIKTRFNIVNINKSNDTSVVIVVVYLYNINKSESQTNYFNSQVFFLLNGKK